MSAPPDVRADRVTIPVRLRPKLAAWVSALAADAGLTDRQLIALLVEDAAQRGATTYPKRRVILIRRAQNTTVSNLLRTGTELCTASHHARTATSGTAPSADASGPP